MKVQTILILITLFNIFIGKVAFKRGWNIKKFTRERIYRIVRIRQSSFAILANIISFAINSTIVIKKYKASDRQKVALFKTSPLLVNSNSWSSASVSLAAGNGIQTIRTFSWLIPCLYKQTRAQSSRFNASDLLMPLQAINYFLLLHVITHVPSPPRYIWLTISVYTRDIIAVRDRSTETTICCHDFSSLIRYYLCENSIGCIKRTQRSLLNEFHGLTWMHTSFRR